MKNRFPADGGVSTVSIILEFRVSFYFISTLQKIIDTTQKQPAPLVNFRKPRSVSPAIPGRTRHGEPETRSVVVSGVEPLTPPRTSPPAPETAGAPAGDPTRDKT